MRDCEAFTKYVLLHTVELALLAAALIVLGRFVRLPLWLILVILAASAIKDIALYPKVWRAYASPDNRPLRELVGLEAWVIYDLDPAGYVRVAGEIWKARVGDPRRPARKGDAARVVDVEGMTLVVEQRDDRRAGAGSGDPVAGTTTAPR